MTTLKDLQIEHVSSVFLNTDQHADCVTFLDHDGTTTFKVLKALVEYDDPIRDSDGYSPALYEGRVWIDSAKRPQLISETNPALTVKIDGRTWHIVDIGKAQDGMLEVGIRFEEPEHSNALDLQGDQHRYG